MERIRPGMDTDRRTVRSLPAAGGLRSRLSRPLPRRGRDKALRRFTAMTGGSQLIGHSSYRFVIYLVQVDKMQEFDTLYIEILIVNADQSNKLT
jgi:hypothetical protein